MRKRGKIQVRRHMERAVKIIYCASGLLLVFLLAIRCADERDRIIVEPPPGVLYGSVLDSVSNQPLEAWIGTDSTLDTTYINFAYTDSSGYYRLIIFPARGGILYCGMDGYSTQMKDFHVAEGESTRIDFKLIPR